MAPGPGAAREPPAWHSAAVHDVDYEHEMGKLSDHDHRTMSARFEAEAVAVIEELERT